MSITPSVRERLVRSSSVDAPVLVWALFGAAISVVGLGFLATANDPTLYPRVGFGTMVQLQRAKVLLGGRYRILAVDERDSSVTVADRIARHVDAVSFADLRRGRMVVSDGRDRRFLLYFRGAPRPIQTEPPPGVEYVIVPEGALELAPAWLPAYPGAARVPGLVLYRYDDLMSSWEFDSRDPPERLLAFYREAFAGAGLRPAPADTARARAVVAALSADKRTSASLRVTPGPRGMTHGLVVFSQPR